MTAKLKNISGATLSLDDIGDSLITGEIINVNDIGYDAYRSSIDIPNAINSGLLVFLDENDQEQSTQESQNQLDLTANINLNIYSKTEDMVAYVNQQLQNIGVSAINIINKIQDMPCHSISASRLYYAKQSSSNSKFYLSSTSPFYINQQTLNTQTIINVQGSGLFSGIMLPELENSNSTNRSVKIEIIIDGVNHQEIFTYDDVHSSSYRLYLGAILTRRNQGVLFEDIPNRRAVTSNLRPQTTGYYGTTQFCYIPHLSQLQNLAYLPRMKFSTSLIVRYTLSHINMYENLSFQNRAVAFYNLIG